AIGELVLGEPDRISGQRHVSRLRSRRHLKAAWPSVSQFQRQLQYSSTPISDAVRLVRQLRRGDQPQVSRKGVGYFRLGAKRFDVIGPGRERFAEESVLLRGKHGSQRPRLRRPPPHLHPP